MTKSAPFLYPLYAKPRSLLVRNNPEGGPVLIGRLSGGGDFVPFWTRAEIENNHLLSGSELVYLQDPVDVYFLQIQGSGLIRLPNGSLRSVHFSASNGREYKSIGKLLVDEQKIAREDISMQTIRTYLREHPTEIKRILQYNDRFIFFKWEDGEPRGSIGVKLTPGRSIAVDPGSLPTGAVAYIMCRRPVISATGEVIGWMPLQRFVFPQDTGIAIKGTGRADIYWGSGLYAETAAGSMQEDGKLFFLVKK
jgi:peptidoglycan lytic transglycosylase A